jgi:hypothetical protein
MAGGHAVAVRHISGRGDGVVIHVETSVSRRQLDSISPPGLDGDPASDLAGFLENVTNRTGFGHDADAFIPASADPGESPLGLSAKALAQAARPPADAAAVTERAIETLGVLFDVLQSAGGDLPRVAAALEAHLSNRK